MTDFEVRDIEKSFGSKDVLRGVSLCFRGGEIVSIVGDNGAGKSTLLKIMAGAITPTAGRIFLYERELTKHRVVDFRRSGVEMVYQDLALSNQQDVVTNLFAGREESLSFGGVLRRKSMQSKATRKLADIGITISDLRTKVGFLSGGQQQAVAIARALMFEPKVLLLDEPTAALAVKEVENVLALLRREKSQGRVVILVSHRLNDVFAISDRIVVMKQGCVAADLGVHETSVADLAQRIVG